MISQTSKHTIKEKIKGRARKVLFYISLPSLDYFLSTYAWNRGFIELHIIPKLFPPFMIIIPFFAFLTFDLISLKISKDLNKIIKIIYLGSYANLFFIELQALFFS